MKKILEKSGNFVRGKKWEPCPRSFPGRREGYPGLLSQVLSAVGTPVLVLSGGGEGGG